MIKVASFERNNQRRLRLHDHLKLEQLLLSLEVRLVLLSFFVLFLSRSLKGLHDGSGRLGKLHFDGNLEVVCHLHGRADDKDLLSITCLSLTNHV